MNVPGLVRFFEERRDRRDSLVLVTIFETSGSTYSKAGTHMLIDGEGDFRGMLSGGCLEGDLALRASNVIESGIPQAVTYDLAQDDELWGLGVGCDGVMQVFLQALTAANGYEPFQAIATAIQGDRPARLAIAIESEHPDVPPGAAAIAFVRYHLDINSTQFTERLRTEKSVLIVPGDHFGMDHLVRISFGLPEDYLVSGLDRINELILELKNC